VSESPTPAAPGEKFDPEILNDHKVPLAVPVGDEKTLWEDALKFAQPYVAKHCPRVMDEAINHQELMKSILRWAASLGVRPTFDEMKQIVLTLDPLQRNIEWCKYAGTTDSLTLCTNLRRLEPSKVATREQFMKCVRTNTTNNVRQSPWAVCATYVEPDVLKAACMEAAPKLKFYGEP